MSGAFRFETFIDTHSNIFNEYLSSVVVNLSKENEEQATELTKEECAAVIKVMELKNRLTDMEMQSVYFRGCYDSVGYLKKAGIL